MVTDEVQKNGTENMLCSPNIKRQTGGTAYYQTLNELATGNRKYTQCKPCVTEHQTGILKFPLSEKDEHNRPAGLRGVDKWYPPTCGRVQGRPYLDFLEMHSNQRENSLK